MSEGVTWYCAGIVAFAREAFVTLRFAVVTSACSCPSLEGTAALVVGMQRPKTASEHRTNTINAGLLFMRITR
jgi:hypothetical protein